MMDVPLDVEKSTSRHEAPPLFWCPVKIVVVEMLPEKMPISNTTTSHCKHGSPQTRT